MRDEDRSRKRSIRKYRRSRIKNIIFFIRVFSVSTLHRRHQVNMRFRQGRPHIDEPSYQAQPFFFPFFPFFPFPFPFRGNSFSLTSGLGVNTAARLISSPFDPSDEQGHGLHGIGLGGPGNAQLRSHWALYSLSASLSYAAVNRVVVSGSMSCRN